MSGMRNFKLRLRHKHLFIVTGPAGCGKTTVAKFLAGVYGLQYLEGDDVRFLFLEKGLGAIDRANISVQYHPEANVKKMANGIPLADADRWDWLEELRDAAVDCLDDGAQGVVLTCSALKKKYRDVIRVACYNNHAVQIHFIYLRASEEVLIQRVKARKGHYMKSSMIKSQLQSLEEPKKERDVVSIDVSGSQDQVQRMALDTVTTVLAADLDVSSTPK
jgi:gluconokinase